MRTKAEKQQDIKEMDKIIYQNGCSVIRVCGTCHNGEDNGHGFKDCTSSKVAKALSDSGFGNIFRAQKETATELLRSIYTSAFDIGDVAIQDLALALAKEHGVEIE